jgi:alpha-D-ribose 1-methylphosphonate 5-triphosphate synthase subunit PhnG
MYRARARLLLCRAMLCYAVLCARLKQGLRFAVLCDAMLCYAMLRQGLGCAVTIALAVQAYRRIHSYRPQR